MRDTHLYEVRPRSDKRGVDLISDALPFGRLTFSISSISEKTDEYAQLGVRLRIIN
jgi:hypothetical protein